jgi:uncharacterized protein (DUF885 family)
VAHGIYELTSRMVDEMVAINPPAATLVGIPGYDHLWNDFSPEGIAAEEALLRGHLAAIRALPLGQDRWERLAVRVAEEFLHDRLAWYEAEEYLRELNSIASPLQDIREIFDHMDTSTSEAWENIASRLEGLPAAMAGYRETLEVGRRRGLAVALRQAAEAVRQARNHAGAESMFDTLAGTLAASGAGDDALVARITAGAGLARRAYGEMADYLESTYLPSAVDKDAVGVDRYVMLARRFLGDSLDPITTYEWGWSEVARLRARMEATAEQIVPGGSLAEVLHLLQTDPARAAHAQAEFRDLMQQRLEVALTDLQGTHFDLPEPIRRVEVKMAPPGGALGAYYVGPSEDFSRAGSVWWSKGDKQELPLFDEVSTAYHEGFPGHHLQTGLQMLAGDRVTRLQKLMIWYSGSGEGWALYAEDLMDELGYLDKPDYVMGKVASEMLRACRVVIDIGSHLELPIPEGQPFHPGEAWTFDAGVEMLETYAAQDHDLSVSEMNRYLGWAGQAISYKIGQQAIRDLRAEEKQRSGAGYDEKGFHARLLEIGSTGLRVMREHMRSE